ncbi:ornithine cyclodeaminase family protein [Amycolatopsis sp. cmx-4-83]|uniref:ornithine cyclodeaminase family protein n=1 Tax=Amycolatopsis sp. cmx-4-83 TaxID=2790940 RepID=UPI00397BEC4B
MPDEICYIDTRTVATLLEEIAVVDVVEEALRSHALGRTVMPAEAYLRWTTDDGWARSLTLPAALGMPTGTAGIKVINGNVANPGRGVARASGLVLLFDVLTGQVRTVMAAANLSAMRTAAVSIIGVRRLAPRPVEHALVIGAGPIGAAHVRLLCQEPTVRTVWVHDLDGDRAAAVAALTSDVRVRVDPVRDRASVIGDADVIVAATTSVNAHLGLRHIRPGTLVVNVGLDDCAQDLLLGADHLVVDSWALVADDDKRLLGQLIRSGRVTAAGDSTSARAEQVVRAELGQLIAGSVMVSPRQDDRVVLNPFGMAVNDIALATAVEQSAAAKGFGLPLPR